MSWVAVGVGVGGAVIGGGLSAYGSSRAASAQNRQTSNANRLFRDQTGRAQGMLAGEFLGAGAAPWLRTNLGDDEYRRLFGLSEEDRNGYVSRRQILEREIQTLGRDPANRARLRSARQELRSIDKILSDAKSVQTGNRFAEQYQGRGIYGQLEDLSETARREGRDILTGYDADSRRLAEGDAGILADYDRDSRGLEGRGARDLYDAQRQTTGMVEDARQFGKGRAEQIERDYSRGLEEADGAAMADLIGSGVTGSSILMNAKQGNRRRLGDLRADALLNLGDQQVGAVRAAKQSGYATENTFRANNTANAYGRASGRSGVQQANQGRDYARSAGRTGLAAQLSDRDFTYGQLPAMTRLNFFSSHSFNPFLEQGAGGALALTPGASPAAAIGTNIGNSMAGLGSAALFSGLGQMDRNPAGNSPPVGGNSFNPNWYNQPPNPFFPSR